MTSDQSRISPPYMSYGVFNSTNEALAESTVPTGPLDRRVLDHLSGADHGALLSGLRFLGFVDDERRATDSYRKLIAAKKDPATYQGILMDAISKYDPIVGNVDIEFGTAAELEKRFREYGVPAGQMLTKTIRFYIKALQEVGVPVSQHITKPKPRTVRNGKKTSKTKQEKVGPSYLAQQLHTTIPQGFDRMPVPGLPNAFIQFPLSITPEQVELFGAVVNVLKTFARGKSGKGDVDQ